MAERRMFAKTIIDSDAFTDMPLSTQALYFHLSMRADDDGFINNPKKIQRMIGASDDDLKVLVMKRFIIPFESGIVVIKHWKIHNYIRGDRKKDTMYPEEMSMLIEKDNGAYSLCRSTDGQLTDKCQSSDSQLTDKCQTSDSQVTVKCQSSDGKVTDNCQKTDGQLTEKCPHRLGKVSLVEESIVKESKGESAAAATLDDECVDKSVEKSEELPWEDRPFALGQTLGKNVVYLSNRQFAELLDTIGADDFRLYVDRLADFIINKNAHVKNHFETILKWYKEDHGG